MRPGETSCAEGVSRKVYALSYKKEADAVLPVPHHFPFVPGWNANVMSGSSAATCSRKKPA